jgi:metallo-beta-lactamase family protein
MTITFFGAARGVTGSKHLLFVGGKRVLLDCGTFQGLPDVRERNRSFPFPPDSIDAVVLSHAHLDHSGMLPLLVKRAFTGSIFATPATIEVVRYMLSDAAGIEMQDAEYRQAHSIGAPDEREPLFTLEDIPLVMKHFVAVPYARNNGGAWQDIVPGVRLKFYDAGHILGSAVSVVECTEKGQTTTLGFTGDLGPKKQPLLHDPEVPQEEVRNIIMESTYGSRQHSPIAEVEKTLAQAIIEVYQRGGKMIVPAFSLGRTQSFLYTVHKLIDSGAIPRFPVFVDSPLATDISEVYREHRHEYDSESTSDFPRQGDEPLSFRNLQYIRDSEESKKLNVMDGPFMVVSASGMMTAGRVVHHLRHTIGDPRNAVFITGYQAAGTVGRRLLEGATHIELHGDTFNVHAHIFVFNEFSAHADQRQLLEYARQLRGVQKIMLVHGEPAQADDLQKALMQAGEAAVLCPNEGDIIELA